MLPPAYWSLTIVLLFDPSPEVTLLLPACRFSVVRVGFSGSSPSPEGLIIDFGRSAMLSLLLKLTLTGFAEMRVYAHKRKMNDFRYIAVRMV